MWNCILLNSNSYRILDRISCVPLAVYSCSNCYLVGHAGSKVLGSYIAVCSNIGSLNSPLTSQVYSDAVLVSALNLIPYELYLMILSIVISLYVCRIVSCLSAALLGCNCYSLRVVTIVFAVVVCKNCYLVACTCCQTAECVAVSGSLSKTCPLAVLVDVYAVLGNAAYLVPADLCRGCSYTIALNGRIAYCRAWFAAVSLEYVLIINDQFSI